MEDKIIEEITRLKEELAGRITELHFNNNPGLEKRYGEAGRKKCFDDAVYHLNYLIEAIRLNSRQLFNHYLEWAWHMLEARNIPQEDLVENIGYIKKAISEKTNHSGIVIEFLDSGANHLEELKPAEQTYIVKSNPLYEEAKKYLELLLDGKRNHAAELIDELVKTGTPVEQIYEYIFQVTQYEVGSLWQMNQVTVAHEHYCTAATQLIMSRLYPIIFSTEKHGSRMVACSVSGELHEIGIRMVSDYFEMDGWDSYYLGSNMPDGHLIDAIREHNADLLAISITLPLHIGKVKALIEKIRGIEEYDNLKIMVGGYPFGVIPGLEQKIGADATARTAAQAVETANEMVKPNISQ
ncbi:cobalamin-binding protein [Rhodohalobacter sp. SW132]|uniref:cobalamin B12-binding domain-containing protein n=1 Tax=Rhodohalobacter sp. SW132 TaxID=2293433 RepID=UPI000E25FE91|nr:cobalamin-dependent protein [Rhodohalobacter sp. SW132]REL29134.1 cobalamin-binding protein [Rhodohalobacter sp. SW132]